MMMVLVVTTKFKELCWKLSISLMGSKIEVTLKCLWLLIDQIHLVLLVYPFIIDPALMRPGRLDRKVEFSLPDLEGRT